MEILLLYCFKNPRIAKGEKEDNVALKREEENWKVKSIARDNGWKR